MPDKKDKATVTVPEHVRQTLWDFIFLGNVTFKPKRMAEIVRNSLFGLEGEHLSDAQADELLLLIHTHRGVQRALLVAELLNRSAPRSFGTHHLTFSQTARMALGGGSPDHKADVMFKF